MDNSQAKENRNTTPMPLVVDLPLNAADYSEILRRTQTLNMRAGLMILRPGKDVGRHNSEEYEECIIILEGEGEVETPQLGRVSIGRGQVAYHPPGIEHNIYNTGSEPLKYIYVIAKP